MSTDPLPSVPSPEVAVQRSAPDSERPVPLRRIGPEPAKSAQPGKPGNFESPTDLHNFLERRSRQLGTEFRVLEQQRQYVRSMEKQREIIYKELAAAMESVSESYRTVKAATQEADPPADVQQ